MGELSSIKLRVTLLQASSLGSSSWSTTEKQNTLSPGRGSGRLVTKVTEESSRTTSSEDKGLKLMK